MSEVELRNLDWELLEDDGRTGMILEVDLEYPGEFHALHNDYPLAPEKMEIREDMLSGYCFKIKEKFGVSVGGVSKLVTNLMYKEKYVVYYSVV